jgi:hypothetical protein
MSFFWLKMSLAAQSGTRYLWLYNMMRDHLDLASLLTAHHPVFFCSHAQLYRILERHLTSTGVALVAVQRSTEGFAGERESEGHNSALFERGSV